MEVFVSTELKTIAEIKTNINKMKDRLQVLSFVR